MSKISAEEQLIYLKAIELAEKDEDRVISYDFNSAREQVHAGSIPNGFEPFQPYLQIAKTETSAARSIRGSGLLSVPDVGTLMAPQSLSPIDLNSADVVQVLEKGVQTPRDVQIALRLIKSLSALGRELVEGYEQVGTIKITMDLQWSLDNHSLGGATWLPLSDFNRDANYPREIIIKPGTDFTTIAHELIHALPRSKQPESIRFRPYPEVPEKALFSVMREQGMKAYLQEETEAFFTQCLILQQLEALKIGIQLKGDLPKFYEAFKVAGGKEGKGFEAIHDLISESAYRRMASITSIGTALAGKLDKKEDPRLGSSSILDLLSHSEGAVARHGDGSIDYQKAFQFFYEYFKEAFPNQSSLEILQDVMLQGIQSGSMEEAALNRLVEAMEIKFDKTQAVRSGREFVQQLENAPDLGPRPKPVDFSKDRSHLQKPEIAKKVVEFWSIYTSFINQLKASQQIDGPGFLKNLLQIAKYTPEPGKILGMAKLLAHLQVETDPILLVHLAEGLTDAGYYQEAANTLIDYSKREARSLGYSLRYAADLMEMVKKLPPDLQIKVMRQFVEDFNPVRLSPSFFLKYAESDKEKAYKKGLVISSSEADELAKLFEQDAGQFFQKWQSLARRAGDPKTINSGIFKNYFFTNDQFRVFLSALTLLNSSLPDGEEKRSLEKKLQTYGQNMSRIMSANPDKSPFDHLFFLNLGINSNETLEEWEKRLDFNNPSNFLLNAEKISWVLNSPLSSDLKIRFLRDLKKVAQFSQDKPYEVIFSARRHNTKEKKIIFDFQTEWSYLLPVILNDADPQVQAFGREILGEIKEEHQLRVLVPLSEIHPQDLLIFEKILTHLESGFITATAENAAALGELPFKLIQAHQENLAERFIKASHQYVGLMTENLKQSLDHASLFYKWKKLHDSGQFDSLHQETKRFLEVLQSDSRGYYKGAKLGELVTLLTRLPHFDSKLLIEFFGQVIDRTANEYGKEKTTFENAKEHWNKKDELKEVLEAIHHSSLSDLQKDRLICLWIEKISGAVQFGLEKSGETVALLQALELLNQYLDQGKYPQAEKETYDRTTLLMKMAQMKQGNLKKEDILRLTTHLHQVLSRHPWLADPSTRDSLASYATEDHEYQRQLDSIYPQTASQIIEPLNSDGSLNLEAAKAGRVDPHAFEKVVLTQIESGKLKNGEIVKAVSALLQGIMRSSDSKIHGSFKELCKQMPILNELWEKMETGLSQTAFQERSLSLLKGILNGLAGESIADRTLFYADILSNSKLPIESKRLAWKLLREGKILNQFVENYLNHEVLSGSKSLKETEYYEAIAKILNFGRWGRLRDLIFPLFLKDPSRKEDYFNAMEKWEQFLKNPEPHHESIDLSDFYDTFFGLRVTELIVNEEYNINRAYTAADHLTPSGYAPSLGETVTLPGEKSFSLKVSNPQNQINLDDLFVSGLEKHPSGRPFVVYAQIHSEALPPFLESFSPGIKNFFKAFLSVLPSGKKQSLVLRLETAEQQAKTEGLSGDATRGRMLKALCEALGWAKLGQMLAATASLPEAAKRELEGFQDNVPPSTPEQIQKALIRDGYDKLVDLQNLEVLKSGSVGDVIKAKLTRSVTLENGKVVKEGEFIVIKVITDERRHYVQEEIFEPIEKAITVLRMTGIEELEGIPLKTTLEQIKEKMISIEMNLKHEESLIKKFEKLPEKVQRPQLVKDAPELSSLNPERPRSTLAMEYIEGKKIDPKLITNPVERKKIARTLVEILRKVFLEVAEKGEAVYQADPHAGNYLYNESQDVLSILDAGRAELITQKEVDQILKLGVALQDTSGEQTKKLAEILWEMRDPKSHTKKEIAITQMQEKLAGLSVFDEKNREKESKFLIQLIQIAEKSGCPLNKTYTTFIASLHEKEGTLHNLDPELNLKAELQSILKDYALKRFGKVAILLNFGKDELKRSAKELGGKVLEETGNALIGALPFGIGEIGSTLLMSLIDPSARIPKAEELLKNFAIMSAGGGFGKIFIDGVINKTEGKVFFERVLPPKPGEGISGKGFARRFVPLTAAMILDDVIKGRPIDLKNTAVGMAHVGIASGATHLIGAGVSKFKWTQRLATGLKLLKVGSVAGAPESGGTTLLGAAVASVVEFTILKGMSYAEKKYVYHQEAEKQKTAYSRALVDMNNLVMQIQERGLETVSAEQIIQVRGNLEQAKLGYMSYFEWRIKNLEEERETARKEFEEDRREHLIDRGGQSVFEINQMYDEKIKSLNREYAEEISKVEGPEQTVEFQSLALRNPNISKMSPTAPEVEIPTIQARVMKRELAENQNAFVAQHDTYENQLITSLKQAQENYYRKELKTTFPNLSDSEINQTLAQLPHTQPIDWDQVNHNLQQIDQKRSEKEPLTVKRITQEKSIFGSRA